MDEKRAIELISDLQSKINQLTQERNNYASCIVNYEAFLNRIPRSLPGEPNSNTMTANEWLVWALKELGYEDSQ